MSRRIEAGFSKRNRAGTTLRSYGIGEKAILTQAEVRAIRARARWGWRGRLHKPWCGSLLPVAERCNCEAL